MGSTALRNLLVLCVVLGFAQNVYSLKCYQCYNETRDGCEENEKVVQCSDGTACAYIQLVLTFDYGGGAKINKDSYMKNCFVPSANCSSFFNETQTLTVKSCIYIKNKCSKDYCNGVAPTTVMTSGTGMTAGTTGRPNKVTSPNNSVPGIVGSTFTVLLLWSATWLL
ncbi:uncharacterized protein LOC5517002 [Nematostella vectensis]|uniref:uncharacterized protein LOC5517002 n=1 Tax=Nematostella vectensis TaxID=45351 RepID=UPI0020770380|nr:uncharacterized protein LOC5517002 [Nematostella vectensis]